MSERPKGEPRPDQTSDAAMDRQVAQTFPASDPGSATATSGARAVPPEEMMAPERPSGGDRVMRARFPDRESAKLAIEKVVRDTPLDRQDTEIADDAEGPIVTVHSTREDAARVEKLLKRGGGDPI